MKYSMVVIDDALPHYERLQILEYKYPNPWGRRWFSPDRDHPFIPLLNFMAEYIQPNTGPLGLEMWKSCGTQNWHLDNNPERYRKHGEVNLPVAAAIYFPIIRDSSLHLWTDTVDVTPVSNRLILFPPDTYHRPAPSTGPPPGSERVALGLNLWFERPPDTVD